MESRAVGSRSEQDFTISTKEQSVVEKKRLQAIARRRIWSSLAMACTDAHNTGCVKREGIVLASLASRPDSQVC